MESIKFFPPETPSVWDIWLDKYIGCFNKYCFEAEEKQKKIKREYKRFPF
jgi:hypothetical protein